MKKTIFTFLAVILVLAIGAVYASETLAAETVKIGYNAPLSGPAAAWGLPGLEGVSIWLDKVNGAGGVKAGDKTYKVEIVKFDNEGVGSKALLGARKLVLEDGVVAMLMLGGAPSAVVQPFLTKHKIMTFVLIASDVSPDRPYLMDVTDNFPVYHLLHPEYMAKAHPEAKTAAIIAQEEEIGLASIYWSEAGFEAAGIEVVYSKPFSVDTTDFAPIITAVVAKKPDIISMGASWPEFQALIAEQAYTQGWRGIITSACWDFKAILAKVPTEFMEGAVSGFPDFDDPKLTKEHHEFWNEWQKKYPTHGFSEIVWEYKAALDVWKHGVELAGSVESEAVFKALKAAKTVPHSFGPGVWWGKEAFGLDNLLVPTWPITEIQNGKPAIVARINLVDWLERGNNRSILFETLKKHGVKTYEE
jgi:branched-chain amino acid transport system substrate-binding protein